MSTSLQQVQHLIRAFRKKASAAPARRVHMLLDDSDDVPVGLHTVLAATEKVLAVNRGLIPPDKRDSAVFKRLLTTDQLLRERIRRDAEGTLRNVMRRVARTKSLRGVHSGMLTPYTEGQLIGNPLSMPLEEINPMHIAEQARRFTLMGPGGIGSTDALTPGMQAVDASNFGFVSPIESPESEMAGIDSRLTHGARIGSDGQVYQRMIDAKTGKARWVSPEDLDGRTLQLPD